MHTRHPGEDTRAGNFSLAQRLARRPPDTRYRPSDRPDAAPPLRRPGLSARQPLFGNPSHADQLAINIESGTAYDLDDEIAELASSVGRLKQVSSAIQEETRLTTQIMDGLVRR